MYVFMYMFLNNLEFFPRPEPSCSIDIPAALQMDTLSPSAGCSGRTLPSPRFSQPTSPYIAKPMRSIVENRVLVCKSGWYLHVWVSGDRLTKILMLKKQVQLLIGKNLDEILDGLIGTAG